MPMTGSHNLASQAAATLGPRSRALSLLVKKLRRSRTVSMLSLPANLQTSARNQPDLAAGPS
eukprot:668109-Heterocapsa_arctica.AAC.1